MKRFYKEVAVEKMDGARGYSIALDDRLIKTPVKADFIVPYENLAETAAEEWREQGDEIVPANMQINQLINTTIDRVGPRRQAIIDDMVSYSSSDLLCYWADEPKELIERQASVWRPYLDWINAWLDINLVTTSGIIPVVQDALALEAIGKQLTSYSDFQLTALHMHTTGLGSCILALAYAEKFQDFDAVWNASQLDQQFQEEKWGTDAEAEAKTSELKREMEYVAKFHKLVEL
jgi:chaperone required for assembly of F1-ATPase